MKICVHCGKEVSDNVEICMNCGCMADNKITITIEREKQWFLYNPPINVDITGSESTINLSLESGETSSVSISPGKYHIHVHRSPRSYELDADLTQNITYRLSWNRLSGNLEFEEI